MTGLCTVNMICECFDKGFCKEKDNANNYTLVLKVMDIALQCIDTKACPQRHRKVCKTGDSCILFASQSFEFLHPVKPRVYPALNKVTKQIEDIDKALDILEKVASNDKIIVDQTKNI